jgi:hypothetical protein
LRDKRDKSSGALLSELPCERTIVQTSDGRKHLLLSEEKHALQLVFDSEVDLHEDAYFEIRASAPGILTQQIEAISCLDFLLKRGQFKPSYSMMPARFRMTPEILYALDLARYGLSQREIAIRIFGEEAVKGGWDDISHHVQSRTYRLLKKGRNLINKGHRIFFNRSRKG